VGVCGDRADDQQRKKSNNVRICLQCVRKMGETTANCTQRKNNSEPCFVEGFTVRQLHPTPC
jgi:hypothetical protein